MTTTYHLNKILAKCRANLALAEKRTPGEWEEGKSHSSSIWIESGMSIICDLDTKSMYAATQTKPNAAFIAACAGSAEAGWRSTIAAIEGLLPVIAVNEKQGMIEVWQGKLVSAILAAWPESTL